MAENFETWWSSIGPVAKVYLICCVFTSIGFANGFIPADLITIDLYRMVWDLHLWRPITAATFLGKPSFGWLFNVAMGVIYVRRNEEDYVGRTADFVWIIILLLTILHIIAYFLGMFIVSFSFQMSMIWIWCRRHEDARLSLYGAFTFSAIMFPWVMVAFHMLVGESIVSDLVGIVGGHAIYFLSDILPRTHGKQLIRTPQFMYRLIPRQKTGVRGYDGTATRGVNPDDTVQRWGPGRPLGR